MTNPAGATTQVIGVFLPQLTEPMARVLGNLGSTRAMVVHGLDGLDEISTIGPTQVSELEDGEVRTYVMEPSDIGLERADIRRLAPGATAGESAETLLSVLRGEKGPRRDIVLLNAAAALVVTGKAQDLKEGLAVAAHSVDSGAALAALEEMRSFAKECEAS
jgi:anthranilate phosphoribosyltransferase